MNVGRLVALRAGWDRVAGDVERQVVRPEVEGLDIAFGQAGLFEQLAPRGAAQRSVFCVDMTARHEPDIEELVVQD